MYMSLSDLRAKFENDPSFAIQFVADALDVGISPEKLDILDALGGKVDLKKLQGNNDLLHTYVEAVKAMTVSDDAQGKARLYAYLHAPWDEEEFKVDTNTRTITVPSDFQKNGVGVVGDHLAEIIFFRIPRFYDVVDLYSMTSTNIYWYNNGNKATTTYYKTAPVVKYAEDEELVLGWAISELAAAAAGQIEFFIEFEHVVEEGDHAGEVDFRLETQPTKLTIKPTLDINKDGVAVEQYNDIVYSRAIYTPIINTLTASPARIVENLPEGAIDFDPETNNITLTVRAVSPDNGTLLYHWNWNSIMVDQPEGNLINKEDLPSTITYEVAEPKAINFSNPAYGTVEQEGTEDHYDIATGLDASVSPAEAGLYEMVEDEYVLSADTEVDSEKTYYVFVPGEDAVITPSEDTTYRTLTTNVPGQYQVYVGNQTADGGIRYVYSYITLIEPADQVVIDDTLLPGLAYLDTDASAMSVSATEGNGTLSYKWHFIPYTAANYDAVVEQHPETDTVVATTAAYDPSQNNDEALVADPALRGWYYAEVINTKNNTVTHDYSKNVWIEIQPQPLSADDIIIDYDANIEHNTEFRVLINNIPFEDMTYQMYVTVDAQVAKMVDGAMQLTTQTYSVGTPKVFAGNQTTFSISSLTALAEGQEYDLNVYIVPVVHLGTTYKRYVETTNPQGVRIPYYTRKVAEKLHR